MHATSPYQHLVKSPEAIEKMRHACRLAADVLDMVEPHVKPGVSTETLDQLCHTFILDHGAIPAPLNYKGFPKSICTSVNHVVCHGIPSPKKILKNGDIINIDVTVIKDGYHGDTSRMFYAGAPNIQAKRLCQVAYECMMIGIELIKPGMSLRTIGRCVNEHAQAHHFSSVQEYCGHGIGTLFHEEGLQILFYDEPSFESNIIIPGLTFTIEPMINAGKRYTKTLADDWTVVTKDKSLSAQWEHTVLSTDTGVEILTLGEKDRLDS